MIREFVDRWETGKDSLRAKFAAKHPDDYEEIVREVVKLLAADYGAPDPGRIHKIDDGDYQGTLLFVIAEKGYQPDDYWFVKVDYGSCSGCDTLKSIRDYGDGPPNDRQVNDYMTLALHIVQGLTKMNDESVTDE